MALDSFTKQAYEEFRIDVDFGKNFQVAEELVLGSCVIEAIDALGATAQSIVLDGTTKALITGTETSLANASLQILVKAGEEAKSPYKLTFKGVSTLGHKWEKDLNMKIKET